MKTRIQKLMVLGVVVLFSFCLTSCVEFKRQVLTYRYDKEKDELRIFQIYEGIYTEGWKGKITAEEKTQLGDVILGQRTFFFSNWISEYNRNQMQEQITTIKKELAEGKDVADGLSKERKLEQVELMELIVRSVKVTNGQFYLNKDKELCAYQEVTVSNVSKLVAKVNKLGNLILQDEEINGFDQEQQKQIKKFYEKAKWLKLDGNQLVVLFPQSREDHFKMRKEMADMIRGNGGKTFADVVEQDIQMRYQEPIMELSMGSKNTPETQIEIGNLFSGEYNTLALDYVREHYTVKKNLDVARIRDAFLGN